MKVADRAWLAGFIDGEGYVGISGNGTRWHQPGVMVRGTHRPTIDHYVELLNIAGVTTNKVIHERRPSPRHKDSYIVRVTGMMNLLKFSRMVSPYTVTKSRQWSVVTEWCITRLNGGNPQREAYLIAVANKMNRRGK